MASETVVSHNVMTSGMLPKHMGWADEWYRDSAGVLGDRRRHMYVTGSMTPTQFDALINAGGYPKLADYLHAEVPRQDRRGGRPEELRDVHDGRPERRHPDHVRRPQLRLRRRRDRRQHLARARPASTCRPTSRPCAGLQPLLRRRRQGRCDYGTADHVAGLDVPARGQPRHPPATTPTHHGGDVWVTDAAFAVMDHEDWSGMLLTFGGIDKAGHMWGGLNDVPPYPGGDDRDAHGRAGQGRRRAGRPRHRQAQGRRACSTRPSSC